MTRIQFLKLWSISVGSMDALTGVLLTFAPGSVLQLLRIPLPSQDALIFLSWIGIFVMAVGLSYALALGKNAWAEASWIFTSLVRSLVAVFLTVRILDGSLVPTWAIIVLADACVAIVQIAILQAGWWKEASR